MPADPPAIRLAHVGLAVRDLEASIGWYRDVFGFAEARRLRFEHIGATAAFLQAGALELEMFCFDEAEALPAYRSRPVDDLRQGGFSHIALETDDIEAEIVRLRALGVVIVVEPVTSQTGGAIAFINDNSGNIIELVQDMPHDKARQGASS